jgi:chemotaxis protein histidine kinase CheA
MSSLLAAAQTHAQVDANQHLMMPHHDDQHDYSDLGSLTAGGNDLLLLSTPARLHQQQEQQQQVDSAIHQSPPQVNARGMTLRQRTGKRKKYDESNENSAADDTPPSRRRPNKKANTQYNAAATSTQPQQRTPQPRQRYDLHSAATTDSSLHSSELPLINHAVASAQTLVDDQDENKENQLQDDQATLDGSYMQDEEEYQQQHQQRSSGRKKRRTTSAKTSRAKQTQQNSNLQEANNDASDADDGPPVLHPSESNASQLNANGKKQRYNKGLRHFSIMVCQRLYAVKISSYSEIADNLVNESRPGPGEPSLGWDEKNIRRRIYDALNVLLAMDVIWKVSV